MSRKSSGIVARRWCIPPAMLRAPGETLEGIKILVENPGELGVLLWRIARDVALWADVEPELRGGLFAVASGDVRLARLVTTEVPPAITAAVDTLSGMLTIPDRADPAALTNCCLEVAAWARQERLLHTAVAFAQAGALASPEYAEPAFHTGVAAAEAGEHVRAATWLRRAMGVARREKDGVTYAAALVELAALSEQAGDADAADYLYRRAYRAGRRVTGDATACMRAAHGLFRLACLKGDESGAAQFARPAFRAYRADAVGGPGVLLDVARFWLERGEWERARYALRRLSARLSHLPLREQLACTALISRAFAEKDARYSAAAASDAWRLVSDDKVPDEVCLAAALDLAHAARALGDRAAFTRAQREALRLAPQEMFAAVSGELAGLWPEDAPASPQVQGHDG